MISVIITTYNDEKTISDAISSILNQSYIDFELIIINDCSSDKTKEVISSFDDKRIVYIENKTNIGRSRSRNKGIKRAKGEFIAIMDGDDISISNRFKIQLNYLKHHPDVDLIASNVIYFNKNKVLGNSALKHHKTSIFNFYLRASEMPHPTWMGRKDFFKKFKYNHKMDKSEDSDLIFRARLTCKYALLKKPLVFYRIPKSVNIRYKIKQIYLLFLSRIAQIYVQKSFYFFPLVLSGLLVSIALYVLGFKNVKMKTSNNYVYQSLLNKLVKKSQKTIVNIISSIKGGGAEIIVEELDKIYLSKNFKSHIIYFKGDSNDVKKNHFFLNLNPRNPLSIFYIRKILKKIIESSTDDPIIHVHLTWPFFFTVFALIGLKNYNLFFTEHDTTNKRRKIPLFYLIDKIFYSRYLRIICISKGVYKNLSKWVNLKIKKRLIVIYNGSRIYPLIKRDTLKDRLPKLISVGRLIDKKNFSTTITAVSKIHNDIESYTIIGEGHNYHKLKKLIKSLKLDNKIKLLGWIENLESYYYDSDIQLIPSLYEGFGLVAAEGMSSGLPVVASNIPGLTEVLGNKNLAVTLIKKTNSPEEWAKEISKTIDNIKSIGGGKIAEIANNQARKFTFSKMAEEYLNIYSKFSH